MSWEVVEMSSFLSERKGRFKPNDTAIMGLKRIEKIDFSGNIYLSEKASNTDMILIKQGDLVISGINVEKGAMSIYKGEEDVVATIHYSSYEYNLEKIDLDFLRHFLKSSEFLEALKEQVPGGIKTEIKPKHILPLKVCIPTNVKEQREVVEYLDKQNNTIEAQSTELTHQLDLVKQLRQAFLREAMQGKLVPQNPNDEPASVLLEKIKAEKERLIKEKKIKKQKPMPPITEEEILFEIPENWVWCRLGELTNDLLGGFAFKSSKYVKASNNQVIRLGNVKNDNLLLNANPAYISDEYASKAGKARLLAGDILVTMTGTRAKRDYLFTLLLNDEHFENFNLYLNQRVGAFRLSDLLVKEFITFLLKEPSILEPVFLSSTGAANQANIGVAALNNILVPLPPLSEQQRIVAKLDELMQYCDELEASIKESQQQNDLLLQQVLREALEPKEREVEKV
jgi:type I restriction enzyme, S subunit